jgi:septum formation protein
MSDDKPRLILASTSPYRRELLSRLRLPFDAERPDVDEAPLEGEAPQALSWRLACEKARSVSLRHPGAWVIGSDQVAELDGHALGKPGGRDDAIAQLTAMSGRDVRFHTALCLTRAGSTNGSSADTTERIATDTTTVRFRELRRDEIERYVDAEAPFDCAGSFKAEGLGITLFAAIESNDPTALIGLPLIATAQLLREAGYALP